MKFFKKLAVAAVVATGLTGCVSSADMNNEAARAYRCSGCECSECGG